MLVHNQVGKTDDAFGEMDRIVGKLVECYAVPHANICLRWTTSSREAYREEIVGWLEDYAKSFRRLPKVIVAGRGDLVGFARRLLDRETERIRAGKNPIVEAGYAHLYG